MGEAKTDAGIRYVTLLPVLRDVLADLKASRDTSPNGYVFGTSNGARQTPSNVRNRIVAPAVKLANAKLNADDQAPLPNRLTPHSLRRTFASLLYALGETPPGVMAELGHTHPGLALRIYAQAMRRSDGEGERLRGLIEGSPVLIEGEAGNDLSPVEGRR